MVERVCAFFNNIETWAQESVKQLLTALKLISNNQKVFNFTDIYLKILMELLTHLYFSFSLSAVEQRIKIEFYKTILLGHRAYMDHVHVYKTLCISEILTTFWRIWPQLCSWTINNLEEFSESNMLQDHIWNAQCSRSMFAMCSLSSVLFKLGSWSIFDLENFFKIMDHTVQDHKSRPESQ